MNVRGLFWASIALFACNNTVSIDLAGLQPLKATAPATLAPRAATRLLASGGTRPYRFKLGGQAASGSLATLDEATGELRAGAIGRVTERIVVTDAKDEAVTLEIAIGEALAIDPHRAVVDPGSFADFDAVGGQPPYRFQLLGVTEGDEIDGLTGVLRAGDTGGRNATVLVTDAAGAEDTAEVLVSTSFVAGSTAQDVALLDADRDGVLDVAVAPNGVGVVPILKGDGRGNFSHLTDLQLNAFPRALKSLDVDGDGLTDLLAVGTAPNVLVIYRQEPRAIGGFVEVLRRPAGNSPTDVEALPQTGGWLLAIAADVSNSVELVHLTTSPGVITATGAESMSFPPGRPTRLAVGDFIGDASLDLAIGLGRSPPAKSSVAIIGGDGSGMFPTTPTLEIQVGEGTVALGGGNLGGGPHDDLAASSSLSNELALIVDDVGGTPTLQRSPIAGGSGGQCQPCGRPNDSPCVSGAACVQLRPAAETRVCAFTCAVSDDCPNDTDCQPIADAGTVCSPQLNVCAATSLVSTWVNPRGVRVVDLDGDGTNELMVTNVDNLEVFRQSAGAWVKAYTATTGPNPWEMAVGDLNEDGLTDVVTANRFGQNVTVLLGLGRLFARQLDLTVGASPGQVHLLQLDRDAFGATDALMQVGDSFLTLLGDGRGGLRPYRRLSFYSPGRVAFGDFTGDGYVDFYAFHNLLRTVELVPWEAGLGFSGGPSASVGTQPLGLAAGDLNEDGKADLLVANNIDGTYSSHLGGDGGVVASYSASSVYFRYADPVILPRYTLWSPDEGGHVIHVGLGKGNSYFDAVKVGSPMPLWTATVTGATAVYPVALDCNDDGRQDFAVPYADALGAAFDVQVYRALAGGTYELAASLRAGLLQPDGGTSAPGGDQLAAADIDRDGHKDLILTARISRQLVVFRGADDCSFGLEGRVPTGAALGNGLSVADLDGDGLPDLAAPLPPDRLVTYQNLGGRSGELRSVPLARGLCGRCTADSECGTRTDRCVDHQGRRQLCGRDCSGGKACPDGFECVEVDGGAPQCMHTGTQCVY